MKKSILSASIVLALTSTTAVAFDDNYKGKPGSDPKQESSIWVDTGKKDVLIDELIIGTDGTIKADPSNNVSDDFSTVVDLVTQQELNSALSNVTGGDVIHNIGNVNGGISNVCQNNANSISGDIEQECNVEIDKVNGGLTVNGGTVNLENAEVDFDDLTDAQKAELKGDAGADGKDGKDGADGAKGDKGDKGDTGAAGADGKDGQGATVVDNGDGTVTVTGANGEVTITQGSEYDDTALQAQADKNSTQIANNKNTIISVAGVVQDNAEKNQVQDGKIDDLEKRVSANEGDIDALVDIVADVEQAYQDADKEILDLAKAAAEAGDTETLNKALEAAKSGDEALKETLREEIQAGVNSAYEYTQVVGNWAVDTAIDAAEDMVADAKEQSQAGDKVLQDQIDANKAEQAQTDATQNEQIADLGDKLDQEIVDREAADAELAAGLDNLDNKVDTAIEAGKQNDDRIEQESIDRDNALAQDIVDTNDRITQVENDSIERDNALANGIQNNTNLINKVEQDSIDRDNQLAQDIVDGDAATLAAANAAAAAGDRVLNNKINQKEQESIARDEALAGAITAVDNKHTNWNKKQDQEIDALNDRVTSEAAASVARDEALDKKIDAGQAADQAARDEIVANQAKTDAAQDKAFAEGQAADAEARQTIVANQALVDASQDKVFNEYKTTQAAIDAGQYAKIEDLYAEVGSTNSRVSNLEQRMDKAEVEIAGLHNDVRRLDGMMAANAAANAIVIPSNFNGDLAVSVGIGHYRSHNGLALGLIHDSGDFAVKATVAGTDADNWNDLVYGASVNFTTNFFK